LKAFQFSTIPYDLEKYDKYIAYLPNNRQQFVVSLTIAHFRVSSVPMIMPFQMLNSVRRRGLSQQQQQQQQQQMPLPSQAAPISRPSSSSSSLLVLNNDPSPKNKCEVIFKKLVNRFAFGTGGALILFLLLVSLLDNKNNLGGLSSYSPSSSSEVVLKTGSASRFTAANFIRSSRRHNYVNFSSEMIRNATIQNNHNRYHAASDLTVRHHHPVPSVLDMVLNQLLNRSTVVQILLAVALQSIGIPLIASLARTLAPYSHAGWTMRHRFVGFARFVQQQLAKQKQASILLLKASSSSSSRATSSSGRGSPSVLKQVLGGNRHTMHSSSRKDSLSSLAQRSGRAIAKVVKKSRRAVHHLYKKRSRYSVASELTNYIPSEPSPQQPKKQQEETEQEL
jgi:hypothetical protein